jgi:hypothetical protein
MDVVIYDEFHNAPLHRELSSNVYPVEMIYATAEVKRRLEKRISPKSSLTFRRFGRSALRGGTSPTALCRRMRNKAGQNVTGQFEFQLSTAPHRALM